MDPIGDVSRRVTRRKRAASLALFAIQAVAFILAVNAGLKCPIFAG
jgi:hypothetical protein